MRIVSVAAAGFAAFAFAAPVLAQATSSPASSFALVVDKKPVTAVRSVEFVATNPATMATGRSNGATFSLKVTITRTADRTFDDWGAQSGALRNVQVGFLDRAGKPIGGYELDGCVVADWKWSMDAASNALATETWTINCAKSKRS